MSGTRGKRFTLTLTTEQGEVLEQWTIVAGLDADGCGEAFERDEWVFDNDYGIGGALALADEVSQEVRKSYQNAVLRGDLPFVRPV